MRILHVNKFLFRKGGADAYMLDLAELQRVDGDEVELFGMQHPDNIACGFAQHFPPQVDFDPPPDSRSERIRAAARMIWSRTAARGIEAVVREFQPDIAHLHTIHHQLSPSILRPLAAHRVPIVMTLHDYKLCCPSYQMLDHGRICEACIGHRFHHAALRRCKDGSFLASSLLAAELALHTSLRAYAPVDLFICPSRFMVAKMREAGVFPERLRHLPHFAVTPPRSPTQERCGVLAAGRLSHEKGLDVLVRAIGLLPAPGATLHIAGDGPERASLEGLARAVAPGRVVFLGQLTRGVLQEQMCHAAVMCVPSRWYENQPMSVLEAFGCGLPVVASAIGGIPELIDHGVDGLLVPHDDPRGLADALGQLLRAPDVANAMGRAGRAKVETDFDPARHLEGLRRLYEHARRRPQSRVGVTAR
jgi:glycosyltransferase involved in cell wall biosynthesis